MSAIAIIGYSGHGYVVIESLETVGLHPKYYVDLKKNVNNPYDLEYIGSETSENFYERIGELEFALGIGANDVRTKVAKTVIDNGGLIINVIDASSNISPKAVLGKGIFVAKKASINSQASVGDFAIVNTGAIVEHECKVGIGAHVAPGAIMLGASSIGDGSFLGAGAVIKEGVQVGADCMVGAGAVVLSDVSDGETWVGIPARKIR